VWFPIGVDAEAFGILKVVLPPGGAGPERTLSFANGHLFETRLLGSVDITKPVGDVPMASALGISQEALANGGDPKTFLMEVSSEGPVADGGSICTTDPPKYVLLRQLDTAADPTSTFLFLTGQPGDGAASICRKLVYTK
jgi:hypothetical protein